MNNEELGKFAEQVSAENKDVKLHAPESVTRAPIALTGLGAGFEIKERARKGGISRSI